MRPLVRVLLPLALAAAALLALWQLHRSRTESLSLRAERARVKREFVERAAVARGLAGDRPRALIPSLDKGGLRATDTLVAGVDS
jgi:hypothetical protein